MDYNFNELRIAAKNILELDNSLRMFFNQKSAEFKEMQNLVAKLQDENKKLKEENDRLRPKQVDSATSSDIEGD